jgi:hypothetical protein
MRKLILTISAMALPLAACGKDESTPTDPEPTEQVIEEPVTPPEGEPAVPDPDTESGTDSGANAKEDAIEEASSSEKTQ